MKAYICQIPKIIINDFKTGFSVYLLSVMILLSGLFIKTDAQQTYNAQAGTVSPVWVKYFGMHLGLANDQFEDIATDRQGNTYIAGRTTAEPFGTGYLTQKYDAGGHLVWQNLFNGCGAGDCLSKVIAVDNDGDAAVSGVAWDSVSNAYHITTVYYNSQGKQQWFAVIPDSITYSSPPYTDKVTAITFDGKGNLYVAGSLIVTSQPGRYTTDLLVAKYTAGGKFQWIKLYDGGVQESDEATDMVLDNSGNVLVTGLTETTDLKLNLITIKYSSNGIRQWEKIYGTNSVDVKLGETIAIRTDMNDNVYVTGYDSAGIDVTIKYDKEGNQKWVKHADIYPYCMALDNSGNVLITGAAPNNISLTVVATVKYAGNGDTLWTRIYNQVYGEVDNYQASNNRGLSLTIDTADNVYVYGWEGVYMGYNLVALKYDSTGELKWSNADPSNYDDSEADWPLKIAINDNSQVLVARSAYGQWPSGQNILITSYSLGGDTLWSKDYNGAQSSAETVVKTVKDASGNTYIAGNSTSDNAGDRISSIAKFDQEGNLVWAKHQGSTNLNSPFYLTAAGLAVDAGGNVYVCASGGIIYKYDAHGNLKWTKTYNDTSGGNEVGEDIIVDKDNNIIVTEQTQNYSSTSPLVMVKYSPDGKILWSADNQMLDYTESEFGRSNIIISDTSGNIYSAGTADGYPMIVKYNGSTGSTLWTLVVKNPNLAFTLKDMVRDTKGNIYIAGVSYGLSISGIVKVSSKGDTMWTKNIGKAYNTFGINKIAVDKGNNLYVAGEPIISFNNVIVPASLIKYDPDGNQVWSKSFPGYTIEALTTDSNGNVYAGGNSSGDNFLAEYNSSGELNRLGQDYISDVNAPMGISVDGNNNITEVGNIHSYVNPWSKAYILRYNLLSTSVVKEPGGTVPSSYRLFQNYPNPFNPTTTIKYDIPKAARVTLKVYNILGQEVETLVDKEQQAGSYNVQFAAGSRLLASGVYLYRLRAGGYVQTKKMVLLK